MKYILSHPRLTASAKVLADKLGNLTQQEIKVSSDMQRNGECIIRYGNSAVLPEDPNFNSRFHIRLAGNKRALSELLQEKEFPHVVFLRRQPENNEFPIVARDELNRGGGIGIRVIKNEEEFENGNPVLDWTPWYNFKFELGVHILGGEIVRVFKKIREDGLDEEEYPIRNTHRGYKFSLRNNWRNTYTGLPKFVSKLYEIIPIQFARLDVGYDENSYRLIEINSAPDLTQNENTLNMYAEFLKGKVF
jgi:hypothetical protein